MANPRVDHSAQAGEGGPRTADAAPTPGRGASRRADSALGAQTLDAPETTTPEEIPGDPGAGTGDVAASREKRKRRKQERSSKKQKPARKSGRARGKIRNRKRKASKRLRSADPETPALTAFETAPQTAEAEIIAVPPARMRGRHWAILISFVLMVLLPFGLATAYLYGRATDQYHSEISFSIRAEEQASAASGLLGAITQINPGTASETDILFEYIRSQKIVEDIDAALDLRGIYNKTEDDPFFALGPDATVEDLLDHWNRMVVVSYESGAGIIHVRANAFTAEDARAIATAILAESGALVNRLSEQAREDAVRFAREELDEAAEHLREVRKRLADFRRTNRIVDPSADIAGQMGLLNALQQELAQALVDRDVLLSYAAEEDQRVIQANRRISAITSQIEEERENLGVGGVDGVLPEVVGTYEELLVDIEFANTAYTQALAALAAARAEARRQSRYLAAHVQPTTAESSLYPRRSLLAGLTGLFLVLGWGASILIYYNMRDSN